MPGMPLLSALNPKTFAGEQIFRGLNPGPVENSFWLDRILSSQLTLCWALLILHSFMVAETMEYYDGADDQNLFSCAICGLTEGDSSNLTTQNTLQTNATVGCGHQL